MQLVFYIPDPFWEVMVLKTSYLATFQNISHQTFAISCAREPGEYQDRVFVAKRIENRLLDMGKVVIVANEIW